MNRTLFFHTLRSNAFRLLVIAAAMAAWGALMPLIYAQFGSQFRDMMNSGLIPRQFAEFGGGDLFSVPGAIAIGFIHPIALILASVFAVGFATAAIAGERQRGTLEVLLARPIPRRVVYFTLLICALILIAIVIAAFLGGAYVSATVNGVVGEIPADRLVLVWLNGLLLFGAIAAIGLATSVSFDRLSPALGITLAVVLVSYFLQILGSLWPDAKGLQPYSLFHYLDPKAVLTAGANAFNFGLLAGVALLAVLAALVIFPRRDLAAPS
jgi:beta-exotoxin I transport system permease protein